MSKTFIVVFIVPIYCWWITIEAYKYYRLIHTFMKPFIIINIVKIQITKTHKNSSKHNFLTEETN